MKIIIEKEINPQDDKYCGECKYIKLSKYGLYYCDLFSSSGQYCILNPDKKGYTRWYQCIKAQNKEKNIKNEIRESIIQRDIIEAKQDQEIVKDDIDEFKESIKQ